MLLPPSPETDRPHLLLPARKPIDLIPGGPFQEGSVLLEYWRACLAKHLSYAAGRVADWIDPPRCVLCRRPLDLLDPIDPFAWGRDWADGRYLVGPFRLGCDACAACLARFRPFETVDRPGAGIEGKGGIIRHWSMFEADESSLALLHELKYYGRRRIAWLVGSMMAGALAGRVPVGGSVWIPIPLHRDRARERGFNQSELIVGAIASRLHGEVVTDILLRSRRTMPQARLGREARVDNVAGAFAMAGDPARVQGRKVMIVDDVSTTGATAMAAAEMIRWGNPDEIWILAFASGLGRGK